MLIGVIGAGKWGSALEFALSKKNETQLYSRKILNRTNQVSLDEILNLEYLVITIPAQSIGEWLKDNFHFKNQKILVASKGIESSSGRFLNEIYTQYIPQENLSFLSGPSFAFEVMQSLPTALVVSSTNTKLANQFASCFPDFIKTYTSSDIIGAEIAGAYKNVIAIASGMCDGLKLGHNASAALISRGLVEMHRFAKRYDAKDETFIGLSGAGDLFLTASSTLSRNYRVGIGLANGKKQDEILAEIGEVAEGIGTAYALYNIAQKEHIYLPIATEVYKILEGKNVHESLKFLLKSEGV